MKTSFPVAVLLVAGLCLVGTLSWSDAIRSADAEEANLPEPEDIEDETRRLDEALAGMWRFRTTLDLTLDDLLCDAVTLDDATETILEAAETHNPAFLHFLKRSHPTRSDYANVSEALQHRLELLELCAVEE